MSSPMGFPREATDYANCIDVTSLKIPLNGNAVHVYTS
jgi:hypothetical protein